MSETTVIVKTIGRDTVNNAIKSAQAEGFPVLVVSDGADVPPDPSWRGVEYVRLGRKWGYYGGMAANVGAALAKTEFITFLDDDDEFAPGAGDVVRSKLKEKPDVDVWIGGVRFDREINVNNTTTGETILSSRDLSMNGQLGVVPGNVCMPTYRTKIFASHPFANNVPETDANLTDFYHIKSCELRGFKIDWFENVIYLVRPTLGGINGEGQ